MTQRERACLARGTLDHTAPLMYLAFPSDMYHTKKHPLITTVDKKHFSLQYSRVPKNVSPKNGQAGVSRFFYVGLQRILDTKPVQCTAFMTADKNVNRLESGKLRTILALMLDPTFFGAREYCSAQRTSFFFLCSHSKKSPLHANVKLLKAVLSQNSCQPAVF